MQQIYEGGNVAHLRVDEIVTINNLKHAWQFVFHTLDLKEDMKYLQSLNALVGSNLINKPGELRIEDVRIGGTSWRPELPEKEKIENDLREFEKDESITR